MTYPPDMKEASKLFQELNTLDKGSPGEYDAKKYELIHDLAEAKYYPAKEYFVEGLSSKDPDYRWACVSALVTHWQDDDPRIIAFLMDMIENDPDGQVRDIAVSSLGILSIQDALPLLKDITLNEREDRITRKAAYVSILRILNQSEDMIHNLVMLDEFSDDMIDNEILEAI